MRLNKIILMIGAILALILTSISAMAQPSLVASYPFNGNAIDESGNGHDGTNDGAVLSSDRFGNTNASYYFDGTYADSTGTTISVASSPAFGPDSGIIIDLWVRPTAYPDLVGTGWEYHKGILWTTSEATGFSLAIYADSTIVFGVGPLPWAEARSYTRVPLNAWTNLRATFRRSTGEIRLFVNGILEDETISTDRPLGENGLVIGRNPFAWDLSRPCAFEGEIDDISIWNWWQPSDTLRIGKGTDCLLSLKPAELVVPIYLDNLDTVKAGDIPLCYDWPYDPDSISFAGTRLATMDFKTRFIDATNKSIRVGFVADFGGSGNTLVPIDDVTREIPMAKVFFHLPYGCAESWVQPPDTCSVILQSDIISLEFVDKFDQPYKPIVVRDTTRVLQYRPGDCDMSGSITISDAVCMISYVFSGGLVSCIGSFDSNCDGVPTISDPVYLINYIFAGGPVPGTNCLCGVSPLVKANIAQADISSASVKSVSGNQTAIVLEASSDARAIQLNFNITGDIRNVKVTSDISDLQLFSTSVDGGYRIGLIDLTGTAAIPSGKAQIATITYEGDGELNISSAIVVDNDASEMNATISNSKLESTLPTEYSLDQNQPNPFNPSTDISFSLPQTSQVKLVVYNILGAEVATLVDEVRSAGVHRVTWSGTNSSGQQVASGIYLYRLTAGDFAATKKMLLLK